MWYEFEVHKIIRFRNVSKGRLGLTANKSDRSIRLFNFGTWRQRLGASWRAWREAPAIAIALSRMPPIYLRRVYNDSRARVFGTRKLGKQLTSSYGVTMCKLSTHFFSISRTRLRKFFEAEIQNFCFRPQLKRLVRTIIYIIQIINRLISRIHHLHKIIVLWTEAHLTINSNSAIFIHL